VSVKSPVREICTPGSVAGRLGNWPSYANVAINWHGRIDSRRDKFKKMKNGAQKLKTKNHSIGR
jgi:hypothetical protein